MKKILVVYYSRSGYTQNIAQRIADAAGADIEIIEDRSPRRGVFGYWRSALEAALHLKADVRPVKRAPGDYDLVVIGTPIWFWNMASPVRAYISQHRKQLKWVAFFCTYGGSGQHKVLQDLTRLTGKPALATLALSDQTITDKHFRKPLARFVSQIRDTKLLSGAGRTRVASGDAKGNLALGELSGGG